MLCFHLQKNARDIPTSTRGLILTPVVNWLTVAYYILLLYIQYSIFILVKNRQGEDLMDFLGNAGMRFVNGKGGHLLVVWENNHFRGYPCGGTCVAKSSLVDSGEEGTSVCSGY